MPGLAPRRRWLPDQARNSAPSRRSFGSTSGEDACTPHPTQKPLELFKRPILNHTEPDEIVYDPFLGSGTCLIAAEETGRRCFGLELDPRWCDVIRDRYTAYVSANKGGRR